ncbi:BrnT family toxin [Pseudanabaena sp. BC1403]|uniref:BrnT family toxin n=1 Tax=Pseudanabaena sp. BC1403 TaxID=2043171 RepID=UPI000CD84698|nr:BrnT family toxin [Pseudanabaena sp. BC1403]
MRNFEYDESKSQSNLVKHGIDFVKAQELWNDLDLLEIPSKIQGETRFVIIGKINNKHWSGVIAYRDQNIRIISVRRSRIQEVALYERQGI